ncbi:MAG: HPP family protein [Candidatus Baltobacteraceae bacterium]
MDVLRRAHPRAAWVAVPLLLAALAAAEGLRALPETEFLLLPPLAVVAYIVFREPFGPAATFRSVIAMPVIGATIGALAFRFFAHSALGVALALVAVLLAQKALRAHMPPALALAVLAIVLRVSGPTYVLGVAEASAFVGIALLAWRLMLRERS